MQLLPELAAPAEPGFFDPRRLIAEAFDAAFAPPAVVNVADWAAQHRWLSNEGGGYVGRWRHDIAPYLREPMEVLSGAEFLTVVVVGPGQSGKTEIGLNWLAASIDGDPGDVLWYMQTEQTMQAFVKSRIDPMVDEHEALRTRRGLRSTDDSLGYKRFRGMVVEFLGATRSAMINKRAPRIVADEWDAYDRTLGDPKTLLDVRRQTYGRESTLLALSHPDLAEGIEERHWNAGIMTLYRESDRRLFWWRCPECGAWSSPNPTASRAMVLDYPQDAPLDEIAAAARLVCPSGGCLLDEAARHSMLLTGRWIAAGELISEDGEISGRRIARDTAGFWITGLMSPFAMGGIGGLASSRVRAERERFATGSDETLRQVMVKSWGLPYSAPRQVGDLEASALAERAEPDLVLGTVPVGVRFLTAWADVQANGFRILVRGWGVRGESWIVASIRRDAEPATNSADWDALLTWALTEKFPLAGEPTKVMGLRGFGYDSGGMAGVTQQGYDAWLRFHVKRQIRLLGFQDGRAVWNVIPTKGMPNPNAQRLSVVRPDTGRRDRAVRVAGTVQLAQFGANAFKDDLAGQLGRMEPGPWAVHVPAALKSPAAPHLFFEELVAEKRRDNGSWVKVNPAARNEALDQMVGTHVIAHLHGVGRLNWDRPPAWAAPWETNSLISELTDRSSPAAAPAGMAAPASAVPPSAAVRGLNVFRGFARRMQN